MQTIPTLHFGPFRLEGPDDGLWPRRIMPGAPCWQPWNCTSAYAHIPPCVSRGQEESLPSAWVCTRAWWSSRGLLASLVERLADAAVLLLGTYRPGYQPPWLARSIVTQMALPQLLPAESLTVVRSVLQSTTVPTPLQRFPGDEAAPTPRGFALPSPM